MQKSSKKILANEVSDAQMDGRTPLLISLHVPGLGQATVPASPRRQLVTLTHYQTPDSLPTSYQTGDMPRNVRRFLSTRPHSRGLLDYSCSLQQF